MAAGAGRKIRIKIGTTAVAGARSDGMTINREHIDITDKDDAGVRTLLDGELGIISYSMTCSGVLTDTALIVWAENETDVLKAMTIEITGVGSFTGDFGISNFEFSGDDGTNPQTFSATFESGGAVAYTAVP